MSEWFLYVVECCDQTLYTGIAKDVHRRISQHNSGRGAAYTAARRPVRLIGAWRFATQSEALKAEAAFKRQPRSAKLRHIRDHIPYREAEFIHFD